MRQGGGIAVGSRHQIHFAVLFALFDFGRGSRYQRFERLISKAEAVGSSAVPVFGMLASDVQQYNSKDFGWLVPQRLVSRRASLLWRNAGSR